MKRLDGGRAAIHPPDGGEGRKKIKSYYDNPWGKSFFSGQMFIV